MDGPNIPEAVYRTLIAEANRAPFDLPEGGGDEYQTLSGWFMKELGRMPAETDRITSGEWSFEVIDMDGTRVDKVLATRSPDACGTQLEIG